LPAGGRRLTVSTSYQPKFEKKILHHTNRIFLLKGIEQLENASGNMQRILKLFLGAICIGSCASIVNAMARPVPLIYFSSVLTPFETARSVLIRLESIFYIYLELTYHATMQQLGFIIVTYLIYTRGMWMKELAQANRFVIMFFLTNCSSAHFESPSHHQMSFLQKPPILQQVQNRKLVF